ncbi:hypothetical protein L1887_53590 [Cichorium endivia]|nr:hypothetical protein L1887_53590 [Cichorium endivia]
MAPFDLLGSCALLDCHRAEATMDGHRRGGGALGTCQFGSQACTSALVTLMRCVCSGLRETSRDFFLGASRLALALVHRLRRILGGCILLLELAEPLSGSRDRAVNSVAHAKVQHQSTRCPVRQEHGRDGMQEREKKVARVPVLVQSDARERRVAELLAILLCATLQNDADGPAGVLDHALQQRREEAWILSRASDVS